MKGDHGGNLVWGNRRRSCTPAGEFRRLRILLASRWSRAGMGRASCREALLPPSCPFPGAAPPRRGFTVPTQEVSFLSSPGRRIQPKALPGWRYTLPRAASSHWCVQKPEQGKKGFIEVFITSSSVVHACPCSHVHRHTPALLQFGCEPPWVDGDLPHTCVNLLFLLSWFSVTTCNGQRAYFPLLVLFLLSLNQGQPERWICACQFSKLNLQS